jgi:hypothetical protein
MPPKAKGSGYGRFGGRPPATAHIRETLRCGAERRVQPGVTDEETLALLNLPTETIDNDRYPLLVRIRTLCSIRAKFHHPPAPSRA